MKIMATFIKKNFTLYLKIEYSYNGVISIIGIYHPCTIQVVGVIWKIRCIIPIRYHSRTFVKPKLAHVNC